MGIKDIKLNLKLSILIVTLLFFVEYILFKGVKIIMGDGEWRCYVTFELWC